MATVLRVSASPRGERSFSRKVADAFIQAYRQANPQDEVRHLDLATEPLPEFDAAAAAGKYAIMSGRPHTPQEADAWGAVVDLIERLKAADKLVISSPMWNFSIPYRLKRFLDVVVQPAHTFSFSPEEGYKGLLGGRPAMLILARGGQYEPGSQAAAMDFQKPYLEFILRFIGFEDIRSITLEPTLTAGPEVAQQKLREAIEEAAAEARRF